VRLSGRERLFGEAGRANRNTNVRLLSVNTVTSSCEGIAKRHSAKADSQLVSHPDYACAVKRRWSTAGESPARELGSLHPEAIGAAVEETKPSEPPV